MGFQHQVDGVYPSLIDSFRQNHTRNETFGDVAQQRYEQMVALKRGPNRCAQSIDRGVNHGTSVGKTSRAQSRTWASCTSCQFFISWLSRAISARWRTFIHPSRG